jgi:CelD/BcsL family acetyltransferase involved in cellulose biosynthesis
VPPAADWDSYLGRLGKLTRRNVRYYRKGVESKLGATVCDLRDKIPETLPQLITLHQMRMRQLGFPGSFASARFVRFHEQVAQLFAEKGWGRLFALRAGDKLIAANYGFAYNGTFSDYSMGFDPAYRDHSVGFVLFSHMLERCMQERLEVDFLDPGQFKELWNPLRRPKVSYAVGASPALLSAYARAAVARSFVNRTLKRAFPARMASRIGVWKDSLLSRFS